MGVIPPSDPFEGGRFSVANETDLVKKARAIGGESIRIAQFARHIRKHAEFIGEQAEALARDLEAGDCAQAAE